MAHVFFFSSRRRHTRLTCDWSSDVCSSDLGAAGGDTFSRWECLCVHRGSRRAEQWRHQTVSRLDRKSTRLNSSHMSISYAVFCLKKKKKTTESYLVYKKKKKKII